MLSTYLYRSYGGLYMDESIWMGSSADFSLVPPTTAWPCLAHALFLFTNRKMHEAVLQKGQQAKFTIAIGHNVKQPFSPKIISWTNDHSGTLKAAFESLEQDVSKTTDYIGNEIKIRLPPDGRSSGTGSAAGADTAFSRICGKTDAIQFKKSSHLVLLLRSTKSFVFIHRAKR